ncbi:MAG: hypothetical protein KUG79_18940 [Pseudomonadales bacterium]|nr:hypothetical protein [Pseudomonadales bacterium]
MLTTISILGTTMPHYAFAAKDPFDLNIDIPSEIHTLDNGLTVIIHEDHKAPIVAVNIW